jgi:hypothetical protein
VTVEASAAVEGCGAVAVLVDVVVVEVVGDAATEALDAAVVPDAVAAPEDGPCPAQPAARRTAEASPTAHARMVRH